MRSSHVDAEIKSEVFALAFLGCIRCLCCFCLQSEKALLVATQLNCDTLKSKVAADIDFSNMEGRCSVTRGENRILLQNVDNESSHSCVIRCRTNSRGYCLFLFFFGGGSCEVLPTNVFSC